jgi:cell fate regulator YaaT (PSP1 superfamily)
MNIAAARIRNGSQLIYINIGNTEVAEKSRVIVETDQGVDIGKILKIGKYAGDENVEPTGKLVRVASIEDIASIEQLEDLEDKAFGDCKERAAARALDMKLVSVKSLFDKTKLIFYFASVNRIDFRELVKELAYVFKMRIEMRQIGVRDQARIVGGFGPCGRIQCCVIQKDEFAPVSIKMAKDQNLNLNSLKISGMCGRLLCCLGAEYETYKELNANFPAVGTEIMCGSLVFTVISGDILKQTLKKIGRASCRERV